MSFESSCLFTDHVINCYNIGQNLKVLLTYPLFQLPSLLSGLLTFSLFLSNSSLSFVPLVCRYKKFSNREKKTLR